jgi:3-phenylpropionate/trans-cinnamate dioxygenase ferredoxin reductase subunit
VRLGAEWGNPFAIDEEPRAVEVGLCVSGHGHVALLGNRQMTPSRAPHVRSGVQFLDVSYPAGAPGAGIPGFHPPRSGQARYMSQAAGGTGIVIVGGALAGGNAAVTLREEGYRDRVTLIGREAGIPFGRPPLSKTYLRSEEDLTGWYVRPGSWYEEHDVDRLVGSTVAVIDTAAHTVRLDSGRELPYQKVLIATGGQNRRLDLPGAGLPGLHYLRTVAECEAIKAEAVAGRRAVVVGMSFIGSEVAASLAQLGVHVTAIFPGRFPLERVLGEEVGAKFAAIHRANGVELLAGEQVAAFEGTERL